MSRQKKLINKTNYPQHAIEKFARCVYPDIVAFYQSEEGQREFAEWQAEQAAKKSPTETTYHKEGGHRSGDLRCYSLGFFFRGPLGLEVGRMR